MKFKFVISAFIILIAGSWSFAEVNFPKPAGFINDYTGLLTPQEKQQLESISTALKQNTGAELAMAIVKTTAPLDPKTYAVKLFEKWKIGEKGKDNGLLVLMAMDDKRIEIEVGYGLEGIIPDATAGRILDTYAIPNFKQGQIAQGLIATSQALAALPALSVKEQKKVEIGGYIIWVIIAVIILGILFRKGNSIVFGVMGAFWGASEAGLIGAIFGALAGLFLGFWGWMFMGRGGGFGGGGSGGGGSGRSW